MNRIFGFKAFFLSLVGLWSLVTLFACAGMYKLWWERERADYLGKSVSEQRQKIWQNAGLSQGLLTQVETADRIWPSEVRYTAAGDHNQLSYGKYILLPRIPDGSGPYTLKDDGSFSPAVQAEGPASGTSSAIGFFLSVLLIGAMAKAVQRLASSIRLTTPEAFGGVALVVVAGGLLARVFFASAIPAFQGLTLLGVLSLVFLLPGWMRSLSEIRTPASSSPVSLPFAASCGLVLIIALFIFWTLLMSVIVVPDDWDAWAIWGAKAKVLALGHGSLHDVTHFGHGDYPLLWPTIWAFSAWLSGGWEEMWSRGWGSVFLILWVWEAAIIVRRSTGSGRLGLLCGAFFVSIPMVSLVTSWSYAEAPFWFLTTACVGCLLHNRDKKSVSKTIFAALLAAAAAYTKNEGVMFSIIVWGWMLFLPEIRTPKRFFVFILTFSLCYLPWLYWTHFVLALESHAVAGFHMNMETLQRALSRVSPALEAIARMWMDVKQWNIVLWLCLGFALAGGFTREGRIWFVIPAGMLGGYFLIVIFHHDEIYWQVGTAWNRLTLHALPFLLIGGVIQAKALAQGR